MAIDEAEKNYKGLVIWNADAAEGGAFSAGADLQAMLPLFMSGGVEGDRAGSGASCRTRCMRMKYAQRAGGRRSCRPGAGRRLRAGAACGQARGRASRPTSAWSKWAWAWCPAGGGLKEAALRAPRPTPQGNDILQFLKTYFMNAATANVSKSALEAKQDGLPVGQRHASSSTPTNCCMWPGSEARAMFDAGYRPPLQALVPVAGRYGMATIMAQLVNMRDGGFISAHDFKLGEDDRRDRVRRRRRTRQPGRRSNGCSTSNARHSWNCSSHPKTQERIMGMMQTGKPVRN